MHKKKTLHVAMGLALATGSALVMIALLVPSQVQPSSSLSAEVGHIEQLLGGA